MGGHIQTHKWAKVASYAPNLILEDLVVEARFKLSLPRASGGNGLGILAASETNKILGGQDRGTVEGSVCGVGFEHIKLGSRNELKSERR